MKKIILILAVFLVFPVFNAFSSPYDMIAADDPILQDILYVSQESGVSVLSFTPPLSPDEVTQFLASVDQSKLPPAALSAYDRIKERLQAETRINVSSGLFKFNFNINSAVEATARFNDNIDWYPAYPQIPALLSLPVRLYFGDAFQLYFEPAVSKEPEYYRGSTENFYGDNSEVDYFSTNLPAKAEDIDQTFPFRAYAALGGQWWNFQIGRDRLSYGTGQSGNLSIDDNLAYYQFARLSLFSSFFKYSVLVSQMPLDISGIYDTDLKPSLTQTTQRYLYLHRLDLRLFDIVSLSLSEGVMVGNSPLELRYLNPATIFHQMFTFWEYPDWSGGTSPLNGLGDMTGSLFSAEVNWNIIKSLSVYGQFVMNQYSTEYKQQNWGGQPNGLGYLAGTRYTGSISDWGYSAFLEFIYTDPYLYLNPSPFASLIQMRPLGITPGRFEYAYIGYPRDTIAVTLGGKFFDADRLILNGTFSWISQGEHTVAYDWENSAASIAETTPSGTAENKFVFSADAQWKFLPYLTLKGGASIIYSVNNNHASGVNELGGQAGISVLFQY